MSSNIPQCPCGRPESYINCCGRFIESIDKIEATKPKTAEQLMRSRYTAYTLINVPYLIQTTCPESRQYQLPNDIRQWAESTQWEGLEIVSTKKGKKNDTVGFVEFKAYYEESGEKKFHHEKSKFLKEGGQWYFFYDPTQKLKTTDHNTSPLNVEKTSQEKEASIGRNIPCPCGSGKKYKRCCG